MSNNKISFSILGDGGWASTLACLLSKRYKNILMWSPDENYAKFLSKKRINEKYLSEVKIPENVIITSDINQAFKFSKNILIAIPTQYIRSSLKLLKIKKEKDFNILSCSKGMELRNFLRPTQIIRYFFPFSKISCLSGPTIAKEVYLKIPTCCVVASTSLNIAKFWQKVLSNDYFRVYVTTDVKGVELGGALKNIIALACGMADGLHLGTNTKSALVCRGLVEMIRFSRHFGASRITLFGLSGLGDLITTCFSKYSRNRLVGEKIAKGESLDKIRKELNSIAEGIDTTKSVYLLSRKMKIDMPITRQVYLVLYKNKDPIKAVKDLMKRSLKKENV